MKGKLKFHRKSKLCRLQEAPQIVTDIETETQIYLKLNIKSTVKSICRRVNENFAFRKRPLIA